MYSQGKIAVVTGAASGIGRHTSFALAKGGADVVPADLERDGLAELRSETEVLGLRGLAVPADATKPEGIKKLYVNTISEKGRGDILMNNAGVPMTGPLEKTARDDWKWDVLYGTYVFLLICWVVAAAISSTPLLSPGW